MDPRKEKMEADRLAKRLRHSVADAVLDYDMIQDGDLVMVALSGGKDSFSLLELLLSLQRNFDRKFELIAVNLDQKQPGFPAHILPEYLAAKGVPFKILEQDTYSVVQRLVPPGATTCSLCSRLRRGALYKAAQDLGAHKIALGHHRDDILETFFLNLFYGSRLKGMAPKLVSDDGRNTLIRPMAYCREADLEDYADNQKFPIIPCNLCGSQPDLQRKVIKAQLREWEKIPGRVENIFRALQNTVPEHLMDRNLWNFKTMELGQPRGRGTGKGADSLDPQGSFH